MFSTFEAVRAEALFLSSLQSSDRPTAQQVRGAVAGTVRRLGVRGCAAQVADEYGDHPDTAVARMRWALGVVRSVYPTRSTTPRPTCTPTCTPDSLALAS